MECGFQLPPRSWELRKIGTYLTGPNFCTTVSRESTSLKCAAALNGNNAEAMSLSSPFRFCFIASRQAMKYVCFSQRFLPHDQCGHRALILDNGGLQRVGQFAA